MTKFYRERASYWTREAIRHHLDYGRASAKFFIAHALWHRSQFVLPVQALPLP